MGTRLCSSQFAKQHLGHVIKVSFVVKQILATVHENLMIFFAYQTLTKSKYEQDMKKASVVRQL